MAVAEKTREGDSKESSWQTPNLNFGPTRLKLTQLKFAERMVSWEVLKKEVLQREKKSKWEVPKTPEATKQPPVSQPNKKAQHEESTKSSKPENPKNTKREITSCPSCRSIRHLLEECPDGYESLCKFKHNLPL